MRLIQVTDAFESQPHVFEYARHYTTIVGDEFYVVLIVCGRLVNEEFVSHIYDMGFTPLVARDALVWAGRANTTQPIYGRLWSHSEKTDNLIVSGLAQTLTRLALLIEPGVSRIFGYVLSRNDSRGEMG